jgi:hypothetical protein
MKKFPPHNRKIHNTKLTSISQEQHKNSHIFARFTSAACSLSAPAPLQLSCPALAVPPFGPPLPPA